MKSKVNVVSIPRKITKGEELVVLTRKEYERLRRRTEETKQVLQIIAEGEKEYRKGRTIVASSLEEALKLHAKRPH